MAEFRLSIPWLTSRRAVRRRAAGRGRKITAIDVDGEVMRVVQTVRRGWKTTVTRLAAERLELPPGADQNDAALLGTAIANALGRLRLRPGPVVMGLPRALVVLRTLYLPLTEDLDELAAMVYFQVAKDLPFRSEDAIIDFKVHRQVQVQAGAGAESRADKAPASEGGAGVEEKTEVLVAAVRRETVEFYRAAAAAARLKLMALGLRSYANARCVEACGLTEGGGSVALVSLRPDEVIIDVLEKQSLVFSRVATVPQPGSLVPEPAAPAAGGESAAGTAAGGGGVGEPARVGPADFGGAVTIEVVRSLHSYSGSLHQEPVTKLVVAGATGNEKAVVEALENRLSIPCSLLDPATALSLKQSEREHAAGSLAAFGLGFGVHDVGGLPFDFLNPRRPPAPGASRRLKLITAAAAALVFLVGVLGVRQHFVNKRLAIKAQLAAQLATEEKHRPLYRQLRLQTQSVQSWLKESRSWLDQLTEMSSVLPPTEEVYLTSINIGPQETVRLAVQARNGETLARVDRQLREAGYDVKPLAITPGADRFGYPFKSSIEMEVPPPKAPPVPAKAAPPSATPTNAAPRAAAPPRPKP